MHRSVLYVNLRLSISSASGNWQHTKAPNDLMRNAAFPKALASQGDGTHGKKEMKGCWKRT